MRKIAGPGHSSNEFADYDAVTNPTGTVVTADWANDVQQELMGIQDELSIAEAAGTNKYILAAIKGIAKQMSKEVGEFFYLDSYKAPAAFDKDAPDSFFPAYCLDTIEDSTDIAYANAPDFVTHLRAKVLTHKEGKTGSKSAFSVTGWAISSNVATLTFEDLTAENAMLENLAEDQLVHGDYSGWRTITLSAAIGDITAGDYTITDVDALSRTISFAFTHANNSDSCTATASFYAHRVAGSTTTARLFEASARTLVSASDDEGIAGLRRRDRGQGWQLGADADDTGAREYWGRSATRDQSPQATTGTNTTRFLGDTTAEGDSMMLLPKSDGTNGNPRTGTTTDPRSAVGHLYQWAGSYVA